MLAALSAACAYDASVLAAPILTGRLARAAVPDGLRHALTAESGTNDGLALPLVMLPVLLLQHPPAEAWTEWFVHVLLWEVGGAVLVGLAAGWFVGHGLRWARRRLEADKASLLTVTLALAVASLAGVRVLGGDGIMAAFVAGAVLNNSYRDDKVEEHHERLSEALGRFFDFPVTILFGAALPWAAWAGLGWRGVLFAAVVLLLRRLLAWLLLGRFMPWTRSAPAALFARWFGPVGAAAVFYALSIQMDTGITEVWPAVNLAVAASVLAHGVSGTPLTHAFGRTASPGFRERYESGEDPADAAEKAG